MTDAAVSLSWNPSSLPSQSGKTAVVTGGNGGVGYFVSEQLAAAGARVILASRSEAKADAAAASIRSRVAGADIGFVKLDLSSLGSVREAAEKIRALDRVDLLINNAGITSSAKAAGAKNRLVTEDGLEFVVGTNAFGPFALTALVAASLRPDARIVSLGSMATRIVKLDATNLQSTNAPYKFFTAYGYSKHAVHAFALELQRRLAASGSGIQSLLAHPGFAVDGLTAKRVGVNDKQPVGKRLVELLERPFAQGKDRGAWPIVRAATDPSAAGAQFYGPKGFDLKGEPVLIAPIESSASPEFGADFWQQAEAATGIRFTIPVS
jgi:NAD(P)-dependent dehydrogenase (short-subunit alcohol dehydrogenase family)